MNEELNKFTKTKLNKEYSELSEKEKISILSEFGLLYSNAVLDQYPQYSDDVVTEVDKYKPIVELDNKFMLSSKPYKLKKSNELLFLIAFLILGPIINIIYINFFQIKMQMLELSIFATIIASLISLFIFLVSKNNITISDDEIKMGKDIIKYKDMASSYYISTGRRNSTTSGLYIVKYDAKIYRYSIMLYHETDIKELCEFLNYRMN